jgi:hypothetical protein
MPDFRIIKSDNPSYDILEAEFFSMEEEQAWSRDLADELPEGSVLQVIRGPKSKQGRNTRRLGVVKIGTSMTAATDEKGKETPAPQAPIPKALEIPEVVRKADDKQLETMAARNGALVGPTGEDISKQWSKLPRARKEASVASAMRKVNAR